MSAGLFLSTASALVAVLALIVERVAGFPEALYRAIRHPVVWAGALIALLDRILNRPDRGDTRNILRGLLALTVLLAATLLVTLPLALFLRSLPGGLVVEALLAASLLSQASLRQHVEVVVDGLAKGLAEARAAVAHIVGRDPQTLDEPGIVRASLESLAENASDGVTAPLFWLIIGGLPGVALYKAINTADSMIGYRNDRYRAFGRAAARLDDLVNLPASRLTGAAFVLAAALDDPGRGRQAWAAMRRDAPGHVSPNAGWPEAALAGALDIRLGGPRSYSGRVVPLKWMGDGREELTTGDLQAGLALYERYLNILAAAVILWLGLRWTIG